MKRFVFLFSLVFVLAFAYVSYAAVDVTVFDSTFVRGTGTPVTESTTFPAISGTAIIKVYNGGLEDSETEKVSSSVITINGQVIFDQSNFNQNMAYLEKEIVLSEGQNSLEVILKGKPEGRLTIQILQTAVNYHCDNDSDGYFDSSVDGKCAGIGCEPAGCQTVAGDDCNDLNANIHPGAVDLCDNIDNDCNANTSDGSGESWFGTPTACGIGVCGGIGQLICMNGMQTDTCVPGNPTEISERSCSDGLDNDCDGLTDGSDSDCVLVNYYCDNDSDGYIDSAIDGTCYGNGCEPSGCQTTTGNDCDDSNASINPGASEVCSDNVDNNCNGQVDENCGFSANSIVFASNRAGAFQIYIMREDGSNQTRVTNDSYNHRQPFLSPDGSKIVFASDINGQYCDTSYCDLYIINVDGSGLTQLTNRTTRNVYNVSDPIWSIDGTKIYFGGRSVSSSGYHEIWVVNLDGTGQQIVLSQSGRDFVPMSFSPDGIKLSINDIMGYADGYDNVQSTVNADGTDYKKAALAPGPRDDFGRWSPDGTKFVYMRGRGDGTPGTQLYLMDGTGNNYPGTNLTATDSYDNCWPRWLVDGSKIIYASVQGGFSHIWIMNTDGTGKTQLTTGDYHDALR